MTRKWIEIITGLRTKILSCLLGCGLLMQWAPVSGQGLAAMWGRDRPARAFPVYVERAAKPQPLAPLPGVPEAEGASGAVPRAATVASPTTEPVGEVFVPDVPYSYFWDERDGIRLRASEYVRQHAISEHSPGLLSAFPTRYVATPGTRWLPAPAPETWSFGARNWQGPVGSDTQLRIGSGEIGVPEWNDRVRLGGVSLSQSFMASSDEPSEWNYSLAFGAVDHSAVGQSGDLVFGPMAGSLALSYDQGPRLRMISQVEVADDLLMSDLTGRYDMGEFGRWRSGVARSENGVRQGWRYRAMADFDLPADMTVSWLGERHTDGFMDIRRHAAGSDGAGGGRQRWTASLDTDRWGRWSGSFENVYGDEGTLERRFGLNQQFWYSPNLQIGVHAEREVVGGDYDIGLRFSFPLY